MDFKAPCVTRWISKLTGRFEIHWVRQYLINFTGLADIVNATVYETISTGLGQDKLSQCLTLYILHCFDYVNNDVYSSKHLRSPCNFLRCLLWKCYIYPGSYIMMLTTVYFIRAIRAIFIPITYQVLINALMVPTCKLTIGTLTDGFNWKQGGNSI